MAPPLMSAVALTTLCGPPVSLFAFVWNGESQPPLAGSGTHTVDAPLLIGMPSTPGYVPKYVSNERFSCMITMTCLIRWMSPLAVAGVGDRIGASMAPRVGAATEALGAGVAGEGLVEAAGETVLPPQAATN